MRMPNKFVSRVGMFTITEYRIDDKPSDGPGPLPWLTIENGVDFVKMWLNRPGGLPRVVIFIGGKMELGY